MWRYYELLSARSLAEVARLKASVTEGANPRDIKYLLGAEIVGRFHGVAAAEQALAGFISRHRDHSAPADLATVAVEATSQNGIGIGHLLRAAGLVASTSEAVRLIQQGGVRIDGEAVADKGLTLAVGSEHVYQVGKRKFARVRVK
jgi:tyrosyl-tRNA synthetase